VVLIEQDILCSPDILTKPVNTGER